MSRRRVKVPEALQDPLMDAVMAWGSACRETMIAGRDHEHTERYKEAARAEREAFRKILRLVHGRPDPEEPSS